MADFQLEIVTPDGPTFSGAVSSLVLPAWEGQMGVLPGHEPMVVVMKPGPLRFTRGGKDEWLAISGGFAEIGREKTVVLAETAETAEAIDTVRAKAQAGSKQASLEKGVFSEDQMAKIQASLMKELVRLKVAERAGKR